MPFGGLPLLEIEGDSLSQSNAILVYVGKEVGLYPVDNWDAAKVDEVVFPSSFNAWSNWTIDLEAWSGGEPFLS